MRVSRGFEFASEARVATKQKLGLPKKLSKVAVRPAVSATLSSTRSAPAATPILNAAPACDAAVSSTHSPASGAGAIGCAVAAGLVGGRRRDLDESAVSER